MFPFLFFPLLFGPVLLVLALQFLPIFKTDRQFCPYREWMLLQFLIGQRLWNGVFKYLGELWPHIFKLQEVVLNYNYDYA